MVERCAPKYLVTLGHLSTLTPKDPPISSVSFICGLSYSCASLGSFGWLTCLYFEGHIDLCLTLLWVLLACVPLTQSATLD
jgi:hypothetical protein